MDLTQEPDKEGQDNFLYPYQWCQLEPLKQCGWVLAAAAHVDDRALTNETSFVVHPN